MVVLDTHALLWWSLDPDRLSPKARDVCDEMIWMENLVLTWEHRDPADRTIVATAKLRDLLLVTKDEAIADFYTQTIW